MKKPFNPTPRPTRFRGQPMHEVDCRQWRDEMEALEYPLRRRFVTLPDAQEWCRRLVVEHTVGRKPNPGPVAVRSLCEHYLKSTTVGNSEWTRSTYRSQSRKFLAFLVERDVTDVKDLSPELIEMYRAELYSEKLSEHTIASYLWFITRLFRWANQMGHVRGGPDFIKTPRPSSDRRNFTDEELRKLMEGAEHPDVWLLFLLTGLRRAEAAQLSLEDVFLDSPAPFLRVKGKGGKVRTVPLVPEAVEVIERLGDELVPFSYRGIYDEWTRERARCGLPADLTPHSFRHTFISWLANRTGTPLTEVQAVAGHADVKTTQLYVHRDESQLRAGMGRLGADMVSRWHQDDEDSVQSR